MGEMEKTFGFSREKASQRTISLFKDQEDKIAQLAEKLGKKLGYADVVREGVDLVLAELEKQEVKGE